VSPLSFALIAQGGSRRQLCRVHGVPRRLPHELLRRLHREQPRHLPRQLPQRMCHEVPRRLPREQSWCPPLRHQVATARLL
jgi:hypothetical protein